MLEPKVGNWYQDTETYQVFEVVAMDDDLIEIQYNNGDLSEFSTDDWQQMSLLPTGTPDDWSMVWELPDEDKHQAFNQYEHHNYKEDIECDHVEEGFQGMSHDIDDQHISDED